MLRWVEALLSWSSSRESHWLRRPQLFRVNIRFFTWVGNEGYFTLSLVDFLVRCHFSCFSRIERGLQVDSFVQSSSRGLFFFFCPDETALSGELPS